MRRRAAHKCGLFATALAVLVLVLPFNAAPADAHANVLSTFPADGAELASSPGEIEIAFNEIVVVPEGTLILVSSDRDPEELEYELREEVSGTLLVAAAPQIPDGWYAVSWRAISADGHPISGTFTFRVGQAEGSLQEAGLRTVDPAKPYLRASHLLRAVSYLATALALGLLGAAWASSGPQTFKERPELSARLRNLSITSAITGIVSVVLTVVNSALILNGGSTDRLGTVIQLILRSAAGTGNMVKLSGLLALCTAVLLLAEKQTRKVGWVVSAAGAYAVLHSYAISGHASIVPMGTLSQVSLVVHLAAGSAWLGGIPGVLLSVASRPRLGRKAISEVVDRYSKIATGSVVLVLVFGSITASTMLESPVELLTTTYGMSMLAKILVVLVLAGIGAYNHLVLVPRLRASADNEESAEEPLEGAASIRGTLAAESIGLIAVVVATAFLTSTGAPAAGWSDGVAHLGHRHGASASGGLSPRLGGVLETLEPQVSYKSVGSGEAKLSFAPGVVGRENLIRVELLDRAGAPRKVSSSTATFSHPQSGIEGLERTLEQRAEGDVRLRTKDLGVVGEWLLEIYILFEDGQVEIVDFEIQMRGE